MTEKEKKKLVLFFKYIKIILLKYNININFIYLLNYYIPK